MVRWCQGRPLCLHRATTTFRNHHCSILILKGSFCILHLASPPLLRPDRQNLSPKMRSGDVFSAVSHSAQALVTAAATLICCLSLPRTGEHGVITHERRHARLSHFARAHSLSMKRRCSISLPVKWTARVLQKAREMEDLVGGWVPSPSCPVSSSRWSERNAAFQNPKQQCHLRCNHVPVSPRSLCGASCLQSCHYSVSKSGAERVDADWHFA